MQSLGRASISMILRCCNSFSALMMSRAKYVAFFSSLMMTRSTFAPSAIMMLASRSWVSGRSLGVSRMNIVIAAPTFCPRK